ncbi:MAG: hypothetical protein IJR02_06770 [Bacteroidaceae bacterium]|nr:hypothetical protein [Bacteroidaceae bacterium]
MAIHVIRDSHGRVEKYLTEKEFQKYKENKGCFKYIVLAILILGAVGFFKECLPGSSSEDSSEHQEVTNSSSSVSNTSEASSSTQSYEKRSDADISTNISPEVPTSEIETEKDYSTTMPQTPTTTTIMVEEPEQELSRKERRALEKEQRKAEKAQRKEQKALEKAQQKEGRNADDIYGY